ncbi:MAG: aminotransferase class I/II-fold pyridoxal phosphate-dependent enzyme [Deltaproteobacteria bacterium]|nr:aminotransferase class I/II-fold pyridoxal phosphate-dependent enzyme [Deltaproteobacteria bacterium]
MNPLAEELNRIIQETNPNLMDMLSGVGKHLFFPKGILSQSAEAKEKANRLNATIGIATEEGDIMHFPSVMSSIEGLAPKESLTYASSFGIPALRSKWQELQLEKNPSLVGKSTSLPVVTCGITHGISVLADMWVDPNDLVILPDMMWGNYNMIFSVRKGAKIGKYPVFSGQGGFDVSGFEKQIRSQSKGRDKIIVVLNFPHNPTGYTVTPEEGAHIAEVLSSVARDGTRVVAIIDDAYFGLFYEKETLKESIFTLLCDRHENLLAIKLDGATKENYVWGLRVGFVTYGLKINGEAGPALEALERKTAGCVRGTISNASHLGQSIVLKSMNDDRSKAESKDKFEVLKERAIRVKEVLADPKYQDAWDVYPFNSGYFMCICLKTVNAEELRRHLLDKYGVGLIALGNTDLRVAFSCLEKDNIEELFDTVLKGVEDLKKN